jgi:hypothetical protein
MTRIRQRLATDWPFIVSGAALGSLAVLVARAWLGR